MILREERPWGGFEVLHQENGLKIKKIFVLPGNRLSLQSHEHRNEYWVVVRGRALVTLEDQTHELIPGQGIFIPEQARHRVANPESAELVFIEVQRGDYLGEDDITRFQDDYRRI